MLTDPGMGLGRALGQLIGDTEFTEPRQVVEFADGENVEIAGMRFTVDLAPVTPRVRCCSASTSRCLPTRTGTTRGR